jgi:hypothetical protein
MKRFIAGIAVAAVVLAGSGVAMAGPPNTEVVSESATISVAPPTPWVPTSCTGVGGVPYVTYAGSWTGTETAVPPVVAPFNLTGTLSVTGIVWTINLATGEGLLRGKAALASPAGAKGNYKGELTLVTQGVPDQSDYVQARGWISATTSAPAGGLYTNVEFQILPGDVAQGEFGSTMGFSDFSVWSAGHPC